MVSDWISFSSIVLMLLGELRLVGVLIDYFDMLNLKVWLGIFFVYFSVCIFLVLFVFCWYMEL